MEGEEGARGGMSGFGDGSAGCADLRAALGAVPPDSILTTAFRVDEQLEEWVHVVTHRFGDRDPVPLPANSRFEKRAPDSGAREYRSTNPAGKGATRYEWFKADAVGSSGKVLIAEVSPAEIPREILQGKGILEVWLRTARERQLGATPRTEQEHELKILLGSFATTSAGDLFKREEEYRDAVARDLDLVDGPIGASVIRKALLDGRPRLGVEDFFSVLCLPSTSGRGWKAEYCVGPMPACSVVLNPDEACGEMARAAGL